MLKSIGSCLNTQKSPKSKSLSAQKFAEYFKSINYPNTVFYQADEDVLYFTERFVNTEIQIMFSELDNEITINELMRAIKQLHNGKSGGPDRLLNDFFSHGTHVLPKY